MKNISLGGFSITYEDRSYAKGDYISDNFGVGNANMYLQMGLVNNTSISLSRGGIMGIGYDHNEATSNLYPNFMDQMVIGKLTNTKLYSLWLNDVNNGTGSILFGGIDTEKYIGTLYSQPILKDGTGNYSSFIVTLTSISMSSLPMNTITNVSFSQPVVLESSTTFIYLPNAVVASIYAKFGVYYNSTVSPTAWIDCKYGNLSYMSFGFESGAKVNVSYSELVVNVYSNYAPKNLPFANVCLFGIMPRAS